ncbi:MAG: GAF domain-containing protein [Planctomycetes bacterium]|nr:GAF domain-containing protein [Planctomycetota bacterium]
MASESAIDTETGAGDADGSRGESAAAVRKKLKNLTALLELSSAMMAERNHDALLHLIMARVTEVLDAERSSLFLKDPYKSELYSRIAHDLEIREIRVQIGHGVAGYVAQTRAVMNVPDAYREPRFNQDVDRRTGFRTRTILCAPLVSHRDELLGVIQVLNRRGGAFTREDEELLVAFASHAAVALENAHLYEEQERMITSFVKTLAATIDARDPVTAGHSERVARYSVHLGKALGLPATDLRLLDIAASLHDVGKVGIRDAVLLKPARLSAEEYDQVKEHAALTIDILNKMEFSRDLREVPYVAGAHHERLDGSGYPNRLVADELTLHARIIAIADVYDALTAYDRPYKRAMSEEEALAVLEQGKGRAFDPDLVDLFRSRQVYALDRREFRRIDLELAVEYRPLSQEEAVRRAGTPAATVDLSGGGLQFACDHAITPGTYLEVIIHLPDVAFTTVGKVTRTQPVPAGGHRVGLRFVGLPGPVRDRLARYLVEVKEEEGIDARA